MTSAQKWIKYLAIAFAIFLIVSILSAIFSSLGALAYWIDSSKEPAVGEEKTWRFDKDVSSLDLQLSAAELTVKSGDAFSLQSNVKTLSVKEGSDKLTIRDSTNLFRRSAGYVTLTIPANVELAEVYIETGAGTVNISDLSAKRLKLDLGAGMATLTALKVTGRTDIDGGAGALTIEDSAFSQLDLDMGVGELNFEAALSDDCNVDLGVGKATLTFLGDRDDYRISVDKGLGEVTVDSERVSDGAVLGSGPCRIRVDSGVGEVRIRFRDK